MGRQLPTECAHGRVIDWGDFGDEPESCEVCGFEDQADTDATLAEMAKDSQTMGLYESDNE